MIALGLSILTMFAGAGIYRAVKWGVTEYRRRRQ